jgi:hypothetical protein
MNSSSSSAGTDVQDLIMWCGKQSCYKANGQCIGDICGCTFGYILDDCSKTWRDDAYYIHYVIWHWTLCSLFGVAAILVAWRVILVAHSKLKRLVAPRASGHVAVCRARCGVLLDTQVFNTLLLHLFAAYSIIILLWLHEIMPLSCV